MEPLPGKRWQDNLSESETGSFSPPRIGERFGPCSIERIQTPWTVNLSRRQVIQRQNQEAIILRAGGRQAGRREQSAHGDAGVAGAKRRDGFASHSRS